MKCLTCELKFQFEDNDEKMYSLDLKIMMMTDSVKTAVLYLKMKKNLV